jgi:hypothetical protein
VQRASGVPHALTEDSSNASGASRREDEVVSDEYERAIRSPSSSRRRTINMPEASVIEPRGRSVLDTRMRGV